MTQELKQYEQLPAAAPSRQFAMKNEGAEDRLLPIGSNPGVLVAYSARGGFLDDFSDALTGIAQ